MTFDQHKIIFFNFKVFLKICNTNYWNQFLHTQIYHKLKKKNLVSKFGENLLDHKELTNLLLFRFYCT